MVYPMIIRNGVQVKWVKSICGQNDSRQEAAASVIGGAF